MAKKRNNVVQVANSYDNAFDALNAVVNTPSQNKGFATTGDQASSKFRGYDTGLGGSKYDEDISWNADIDEENVVESINEYRANKQSAWAHLGAGLSRTAIKAAAETAKLPGIVVGLSMGITGQIEDGITGEDNTNFIDTVFNNAWIKGLDSINEEIKSEYLPVYVKKAVQDGDLGDKIMSSAFWATDGADGAGFALGMILPGAMLGKLGLGSKMIGAMNRVDKAREFFTGAERAEEFVKAASKLGVTARNIDSGISISYNTIAEAGAEATQAGTETRANEGKIVNGWKSSGYLDTPEYQIEAKKYLESLDLKRQNGNLTTEQQNALTSDPLKVQEAVLHQRFENEVASMQSNIFGRNVAILLGPNTLMHMQLFGKAGRAAEKIAEKGAVEGIGTAGRISKIINSGVGKAVTKLGERVVKNTASEGFFEEGLQTSTANQFKRYVAENKSQEIGFEDTIPDTYTEYAKMLGTTEGQVAIMLGGVLGTGMTSIAAYGKAKQETKIKNEITNRLSVPMNNLNNIFTIGDIYKKDKDGNIIYEKDEKGNPTTNPQIDLVKSQEILRSLILNDEKLERHKEAVANGDNSYLEEQQSNAIFQLAKTAAYNGEKGLSLLKEQLDANSQLTDVQERDKNNDGSKKTYKEIVNETMETAKFLQKQNDKFQDFSEIIIKLESDKFKDEETAKKYRTVFLNELNSRYLNVQNKLRFNNKKLENLKNKRSDALKELGLQENLVTEDEILLKEEQNNPLLKSINDDVRKTESDILKNAKDISEVWKGGILEDSFKQFVNDNLDAEEQSSDTKLESYQEIFNTINTIEDKASLISYLKSIDKKYLDETAIQDEINDRYAYLNEQEKINNDLKAIEILEADEDKFEADKYVESENNSDTTESVINNNNNNGLETSQTSDNKEIDENEEIFDKDPSKENNLDDSTNPLNANKNQGAARVVSTNQKTGDALYPNLKDFVEFEKIPRDKTNDKVTFEVGDINLKDQTFTANAILERIKKGEAVTEEEITYLSSYLPIKVTITNGKDSASSFIDSMTSKSNKIVEAETLPLRKSIIKALIANKGSFKSIEGKVAKQFTGTLKLGGQNSNVLELDVFKEMTPEEKIQYFKKNTVYVSNKGEVKYCASGLTDETTSLSSSNKGEVFLKIPMINGKIFYLKLNTSRLSNEKAEDVLSLITLKSNLIKDKNEFSMEDLESYINNDLPFVKNEFEFIKRNNDSIDVNLDRLINFIIFSQNTNAKTKLTINKDGSLTVGELIHKVNKIMYIEGSKGYTYTTDKLNNLSEEERVALINYLQYKRHNVLITKDETATFNNDDYINYLLGINSDYAILTTNAAVNEPTFQGYSNIYLNQSVVNKNAKKVIPTEETEEVDLDNPEDLLDSLTGNYGGIETKTIKIEQPIAPSEVISKQELDIKKSNIEKRRKEELNAKDPQSGELKKESSYNKHILEKRKGVELFLKASEGLEIGEDNNKIGENLINLGQDDFISLPDYYQKDLWKGKSKEVLESIGKTYEEKVNEKYDAEIKDSVKNEATPPTKGVVASSIENEKTIKAKFQIKEQLDWVTKRLENGMFSIENSNGKIWLTPTGEFIKMGTVDVEGKNFNAWAYRKEDYVKVKKEFDILIKQKNILESKLVNKLVDFVEKAGGLTDAKKVLESLDYENRGSISAFNSHLGVWVFNLLEDSKRNFIDDFITKYLNLNESQLNIEKQIADLEIERQRELKTAKIKLPVLDLSASENPEQYPKEAAENDRKIKEWKKLPSIINAKYDAKINTLKGVIITEVKVIKSNNLQEVFKSADAKTKAKIVTVIAKQLGLMNKVNPKDMNSSFNELYSNLKDNESLEKEIEKICGI